MIDGKKLGQIYLKKKSLRCKFCLSKRGLVQEKENGYPAKCNSTMLCF
jgi:hypothetical protein